MMSGRREATQSCIESPSKTLDSSVHLNIAEGMFAMGFAPEEEVPK